MIQRIRLFVILILISLSVTAQEYTVSSIQFEGSKKTNIGFLKI